MTTGIEIRYGDTFLPVTIPEKNFAGVFTLQPVAALPYADEAIGKALAYPIASPPLSVLAKGCHKIIVVCDDHTRRTPVNLLLPPLLNSLSAAGVNDENISILFAGGSHRPMTTGEMKEKIGEAVYRRIHTENHDYFRDVVYQGKTDTGIPIYLNKHVAEADFVIGLGSIIPHRYCGWSGGGKIILPGVCGEETLAHTHLLITREPSIQLGSIKNTAREEINKVASKAGLRFIINTVLNSCGQMVGIVAGEPVRAHHQGVELARQVCGVAIPQADIVVISSYPEDLNLWQVLKALYAADLVVKDGGTVILVSPLHEGIGEHNEFIRLLGFDCKSILRKLNNGEFADRLSAAAAYAGSQVIDRADVVLVSEGFTDETATQMRMHRFTKLQDATDCALARIPQAKIICINEGTEILPLTEE